MNNNIINNVLVGKRISKERKRLGLSRESFAEIVELSDYYIGQLERGERQMSLPALVKIAKCLHLSLDYLVLGEGKSFVEPNGVRENQEEYKSSSETTKNEIKVLIERCSLSELKLLSKVIKTILPYTGNLLNKER